MWLRRKYLVVYRSELLRFGIFRCFCHEITTDSAGAALGEYLDLGAATLAHFWLRRVHRAAFGGLHADPASLYE
jgi:hypothetical protein